jgi:hypothetical protein
LESEPERAAAKAEAQKAKLEALERKLGIQPTTTSPKNGEGSGQPAQVAGKKHRLDDSEYVEETRELIDGVKNAVSAGKYRLPLVISRMLIAFRSTQEEEESKD